MRDILSDEWMEDEMGKVVKIEDKAAAIASDGAGILGMIDRMNANPAMPVERIEQMFNLHLRVQEDASRKEYAAAMVAAQGEMRAVKVDADNPQTRSKYATYDALDRALRPVYTKHNLAISYNTETPSPDVLRVIAYVTHASGYEREFKIDMPADGKGAKGGDVMTKTHAAGSAFSYGRRYLLSAIFNVATTRRDDDGNAAGGGVITGEQAEELAKLITETKTDIAKFLEVGGIESLSDLPARQYMSAKAMLLKKKERAS